MEEKITCIYHSRDLDGWTSAAIVKKKFPDAKLIGWDYGDDIPELEKGGRVIMVDISFPPKTMNDIANRHDLVWIDHHKSAINAWDDYFNSDDYVLRPFDSYLDTQRAACELTWEYFFQPSEMPEMVRLLGRYDCFGHKGTEEENDVLMFQYGARSIATNPEQAKHFIYTMDPDEPRRIMEVGECIYKYLCVDAKSKFEKLGFDEWRSY